MALRLYNEEKRDRDVCIKFQDDHPDGVLASLVDEGGGWLQYLFSLGKEGIILYGLSSAYKDVIALDDNNRIRVKGAE